MKFLDVSLCIFMYLLVSFETGSKDTKRYKKIHVSFGKNQKIQKDTKRYMYLFVSFCIFLYLLNRFQKIHKDT